MDTVLVNFCQILRRCGLRVSVSESLDGVLAASAIGMEDRTAFKAALRASLIKKRKDIPLFDDIFDAYFTDTPSDMPLEEVFGHGLPQPGDSDEAFEEAMRRAMQEIGGVDELTEALLQGDVEMITAEMMQHLTPEELSNLQNMFQRGRLVRVVLDKMGWQKIQQQMKQLIKQLHQQGDHEAAARVQERFWELQDLFPKWVSREVNERVKQQFQPKHQKAPEAKDLMEKDFAQYSDSEIKAMEEIIEQLARKLREDWSRRAKLGGSKRLDVARTMRAAMGTNAIPIELHWKQKRRNRLNLAILCDVSSSVRNASRFMLQLVYSLQQQRGRVRSFVFIGDLDEVTEAFEGNSIDEAVNLATSEANITYWAHSDFGNSFRQFLDNHSDAITSRTTVIVLGDGRNNWFDPQIDAVQEIHERSRKLIWLNPENRWSWGSGDSLADVYRRHSDAMFECCNLTQLTQAMEHLMATTV